MIRRLDGDLPALGDDAFVHEGAEVIGRVRLGERASIWPRAVVRGDAERIEVGADSNIQDGSVLHADAGFPCLVGDRVTVGHLACVHGCVIEDEVLVGMGSTVMNGAVVGTGSIVGAAALVPEGMEVPAGSLVLGVPGRVVRPTTAQEREGIRVSAAHYVAMGEVHRRQQG